MSHWPPERADLREIPSGEHLEYGAKVHFSPTQARRPPAKVDISVGFHANRLPWSETSGCNVSLVIATLRTEGTVAAAAAAGRGAEASPHAVFTHYFRTF